MSIHVIQSFVIGLFQKFSKMVGGGGLICLPQVEGKK
jgi:hypothetical protein